VINFYNLIHSRLTKQGIHELIFWREKNQEITSCITNKDLLQSISNYRQQLLRKNIKPGAAILLGMPVSIAAINAILSIQSIGAIPVLPPAKPALPLLLSIIRKQKIKTIIVKEKPGILVSIFLSIAGVRVIRLHDSGNETNIWKPELVSPEQAALITHSSGSTGKPKSIYRSHRVLSAQHLVLKKVFPPLHEQHDFPLFPNIILHNLAAGVTSIIPDIPGFRVELVDPSKIIEQMKSSHVNTLTGNVFYFKKIIKYLEQNPVSFPSIKAAGIGGSPVHEKIAHSLRQSFINADCYIIYGMSEAEPISIRKINSKIENPLNGYAVGNPCDDLEVRINATTKIQTAEALVDAGEIEIRGVHVATANKNEWLKTGDIGYLTTGKQLYLTARKGNEQSHKGIHHYQVEHLLLQQDGVENGGVLSTANGFIVFIEGFVTKEDIWEILNISFPQGIIKDVYFRSKIPVDARHHSKILYSKLK